MTHLTEIEARAVISERLARASEHRAPALPRRQQLARQLRRFADRIDN